jgi:hypothetical protein
VLQFQINRINKRLQISNRCLLTMLLFVILVTNTYGQYYQGITPPYDINAGLPHNEINDIIKDDQGYVWIATDNGLSRYDGFNFINFNNTTHPLIFNDNRIIEIQIKDGVLYLLTSGDGLIELQPKTITFKKIYTSNPVSLTFSNDTTAILFDTGTLLFQVKNRTVFKQKFNVFAKSNLIIHLGQLYISLNNQEVIRIDPKTPSKQIKVNLKDTEDTGEFCKSKKYGIILWNGDIVRILKENTFVEHPEFVGKKIISYFFEESDGKNMYIEKSRVPIVNFGPNTIALRFGGNENIQFKSIYRISETCFLIATNQGVVKIIETPALSKRIDDFSLFNGDQIIVRRRIVEYKNKRYYLGYPNILVEDTQALRRLTSRTLPTYDGIIFNDELFCTTEGNGLISIDLNTERIRSHNSKILGSNETFECIARFSDSLLILGGGNKIVAYNPSSKQEFSHYLKKGTVIHDIVAVKNTNSLYLGTSEGLTHVRLDSQKGFETVSLGVESECDISDLLLLEDKKEIWAATNQGVYVYSLNPLKIRSKYTKEQEVSNQKVVALIEDQNRNIWASTYSGLTMYETKNGNVHFVNKKHGIINTEFNYKSVCLLNNGQLILGGLNSFEIINPNTLKEFKYTSRIIISGIEKIRNEEDKSFSTYILGEEISFITGKEALKIYLTNLDFQFGQGYTFMYSIDSKNWFNTDKKNWILLSNIAYGDYILTIRMFNPFSQLVDEQSFPLNVSAPFYTKTGFYISIIGLIILLSILFVLYLLRSIRIKAITKSKIAMDLHDESGTILTRLLLMSKREKFDTQEKERLQTGLKEVLFSFRTYLDSISRNKYAMHDLNDEIQEFANSTCTVANIRVDYQIEMDKNYLLKGELFRDIKLSIYEIVTNCIKHSNADKLSLKFVAKNKNLRIQISDNGFCNIAELELNKGNGIRNIKKRITRNKGQFTFYILEENHGLTIEIQLPLK